MCGIISILNDIDKYDKNILEECLKNGEKRGPEYHISKQIDNNTWFGFHRLAINGLNDTANQPLTIDNITLICNGEIYNYKELYETLDIVPHTESDCEIIIHLYKRFGMQKTLELIHGVYAFVLYEQSSLFVSTHNKIYVARDPFGVRPLYVLQKSRYVNLNHNDNNKDNENIEEINNNYIYAFASEIKALYPLYSNTKNSHIHSFTPGTYSKYIYSQNVNKWICSMSEISYFSLYKSYTTYKSIQYTKEDIQHISSNIFQLLSSAVKMRVEGTTDRPIACLLSGGLDSSLISALVKKYYKGDLHTYSIGMKGSKDLEYAKKVAEHISSIHTEVLLTEDDFFNAIPRVIKNIESYDTTTVRASVGNYLLGEYISKHSDAKVIFNGDGSDEVTGGYIYTLIAPNDFEFDTECNRLLKDIHRFDVLRSDKSISSNGLEPRTPFLDKDFVRYYTNLNISLRNPRSLFNKSLALWDESEYTKKRPEKLLLRYSIHHMAPTLLPEDVLWRSKEAFSDGVSGETGSWYEIITRKLENMEIENNIPDHKYNNYCNPPKTKEQLYYRHLFETYYPNCGNVIPYFWMPKYVNAKDASARTLDIYYK